MKKVIVIVIYLTGCAAAQSGVIPEGKDAYLLIMSGGIRSSSTDLRIKAHKEAGIYCMGMNKRPETISEKTIPSGLTTDMPEEELKFRCIASPEELNAPNNPDVPAAPAAAH